MSVYFPTLDDCAQHTIFPGVHICTYCLEKLMLSYVEMEPGAVVELHQHPHEQMGLVLEGRARFFIGDEEKLVQPGDRFRIPGNVPHKVINLDQPFKALDAFHPVREEYR